MDNAHGAHSSVTVPKPHTRSQADTHPQAGRGSDETRTPNPGGLAPGALQPPSTTPAGQGTDILVPESLLTGRENNMLGAFG